MSKVLPDTTKTVLTSKLLDDPTILVPGPVQTAPAVSLKGTCQVINIPSAQGTELVEIQIDGVRRAIVKL